ncbi:MAG TPA: hypothetical protein PKW90_27300, partial [Myxococcota bacterium]|nr:hypothetical protein [Myxococcota bacterium]
AWRGPAGRGAAAGGGSWLNYTNEFIQGKFDFEVQAGSTEPHNESFRRQSSLQLVDASMPFLEMQVANPAALYQQVLSGFGIRDVPRFVNPQAMAGMMMPGGAAPGGPAPGAPPGIGPGGPPMPGQMPLPGMGAPPPVGDAPLPA